MSYNYLCRPGPALCRACQFVTEDEYSDPRRFVDTTRPNVCASLHTTLTGEPGHKMNRNRDRNQNFRNFQFRCF